MSDRMSGLVRPKATVHVGVWSADLGQQASEGA